MELVHQREGTAATVSVAREHVGITETGDKVSPAGI